MVTWKMLVPSTVAVSLAAFLSLPAQAQVQQPGFFGSLEGLYWLDSGKDAPDDLKSLGFKKLRPDDGFGGKAYGGYRFESPWDVAFGFQYSDLSKGKDSATVAGLGDVKARQDGRYWTADLEAGYNYSFGDLGLRPFIGARYADFDHRTRLSNGIVSGSNNTDWWGAGPRAGVDATYRLGDSRFNLFGSMAGSYLFGDMKEKAGFGHESYRRDVWQVDGRIGIGYDIASNFNIGAGYRAEYWNGVADDEIASGDKGRGDRLMHGPFLRATYNLGAPAPAPRPAPAAAQAPVPAPAPAPAAKRSFQVFFDFDKANITAEGARTIADAAEAAKAGNATTLTVTGHTDAVGTEQYNMALSLRRANAVKDELVRQGIPANEIVIYGKGKSEPLVPTADGVREPQNRRVEIVIG